MYGIFLKHDHLFAFCLFCCVFFSHHKSPLIVTWWIAHFFIFFDAHWLQSNWISLNLAKILPPLVNNHFIWNSGHFYCSLTVKMGGEWKCEKPLGDPMKTSVCLSKLNLREGEIITGQVPRETLFTEFFSFNLCVNIKWKNRSHRA